VARLDYPLVFAICGCLTLGAALVEAAFKVHVPAYLKVALVAVVAAGMIGTIYMEGTGRVYPLPPDSSDA
jgi:hypothetical protein